MSCEPEALEKRLSSGARCSLLLTKDDAVSVNSRNDYFAHAVRLFFRFRTLRAAPREFCTQRVYVLGLQVAKPVVREISVAGFSFG